MDFDGSGCASGSEFSVRAKYEIDILEDMDMDHMLCLHLFLLLIIILLHQDMLLMYLMEHPTGIWI